MLLVNDLLLKGLWPGAWIPGKLSDLAWMMFAPPVLAYVLSFVTPGRQRGQRAAFVVAYAGLPVLYAAFNTFQPVHDVVLHVLGFAGGDGPRSPLDPTDSIVIPVSMAVAIWVWRRPPLDTQSIRTRFAFLAATAAALASVASSYAVERGVEFMWSTDYGAPATGGSYVSLDGGLTWKKTSERYVPAKRQQWIPLKTEHTSDAVFILSGPHLIGERRALEWGDLRGAAFILDSPRITGVFSAGDIRITDSEVLIAGEVIYSFEYLRSAGNRWIQALDKREIEDRWITTRPLDLFYDSQSGNLILAMGLQGVVVVAPDGTTTRVAVGRYSPTDFSFGGKVRTFFSSLAFWGITVYNTGVALLLAFSFAAIALVASAAPNRARWAIALAAAISAFLAISVGVYPHVIEHPWDADSGWRVVGYLAFLVSGLGLVPLLMAIGGLANARTSCRQLLAVAAASVGMLMLIWVGALVLFETGPFIANFVAVGLVGLAAFGLWALRQRLRNG